MLPHYLLTAQRYGREACDAYAPNPKSPIDIIRHSRTNRRQPCATSTWPRRHQGDSSSPSGATLLGPLGGPFFCGTYSKSNSLNANIIIQGQLFQAFAAEIPF